MFLRQRGIITRRVVYGYIKAFANSLRRFFKRECDKVIGNIYRTSAKAEL